MICIFCKQQQVADTVISGMQDEIARSPVCAEVEKAFPVRRLRHNRHSAKDYRGEQKLILPEYAYNLPVL